MKRDRRPIENELRALLRRGDPALGDPGPDGADLARMRRTILAVAERGERRSAGARLAVAGALAAAAAVAVVMWPEPPGGTAPVRPASASPSAAGPARESTRESPALRQAAAPAPRPARTSRVLRPEPDPVLAAVAEPAVVASPAVAAEETPRATSVRFTTPSGTQIIWMLGPRAEL